MDLLNALILFDTSKPSPALLDILIYTSAILIISNLVFVVLCSLFGIDSNKTLDTEKNKEFEEWSKKNIAPWTVAFTELLNTTIYSPIAEEITFRLLLMKVGCVIGAGMNPWTANIIQAIIFGVMHLSNIVHTTQTTKYTVLQTISAMISGFVSGWVYIKCNSLLPSLLAHMINNGVAGLTELIGYLKYKK